MPNKSINFAKITERQYENIYNNDYDIGKFVFDGTKLHRAVCRRRKAS